ncbi:hypothetical protein [Paenibacillus sp. 453mf]|uniref:hypothetical protein n=1 Tax=Paenibacillus sp. 453mf TaxID=1761874 RepID=UPI0008EC077A|nr:hypothetical protein [Paenibacillus sp. 453mf]SFT00528.1 hypothetical protein SAMN04488601_11912 [Paenibacillus sp. 453mf]
MTIVPTEKVKQDPQSYLFHFPSVHPIKYTRMFTEHHHWKAVEAAEKVAKMCGRVLVPASCLHWERKERKGDRRIQIGKHAFYALALEELTKNEHQKYMKHVQEEETVFV